LLNIADLDVPQDPPRADLALAGIAHKDEAGRYVD
jgi:hypothetical protein